MQRENFFWPVRVYYEDTDAEGVVYYANYLKYFERARSEWLRACGVELDVMLERDGVMFVVVEAGIRYLAPARYNDELRVTARARAKGAAQMVFEQTATRRADSRDVTSGTIRVACVAHSNFAPRRIPKWVRERLF